MADTLYSNLKGGGIRSLTYGANCEIDCDSCNTTLPAMPRKVNTHEHPSFVPNWIAYDPSNSDNDFDCVAIDEVIVGAATIAQVPVGYTMHRLWVPPFSVLKSIGITHTKANDPYGSVDTTMDGLAYNVIANLVDVSTCPPTIGAAAPTAVPAAFAGVVASTAGTIVAPVLPASGGYVTGAAGILLSMVITVRPTNNGLSGIQGSITMQANIETFNSLIRDLN